MSQTEGNLPNAASTSIAGPVSRGESSPVSDPINSPSAPELSTTGRPARARRLPKALKDFIPSSVSALRRITHQRRVEPPDFDVSPWEPHFPPSAVSSPDEGHSNVRLPARPQEPVYEDREVDGFGLYRSYLVPPAIDPDAVPDPLQQCDEGTLHTSAPQDRPWWAAFGHGTMQAANNSIFYPFLNATTFRLMDWFYSGSSMKSLGELDRLVTDVILAEDFDREDLCGFNAAREANRLDELPSKHPTKDQLSSTDGWHHANVKIRLPAEGVVHASEADAPEFEVPGLYYRKLMQVITAAFQDVAVATWSMVPHRLWWKNAHASADEPPERVHTEMYNSEAMVLEYEKLAARLRAPGDNLE